ncbi:MAG: hypothetical protein WBA28_01455, partial [Microbacteriaceae bacterium]
MSSIQHGRNVPRRSNNPKPRTTILKWYGLAALGAIVAFGGTILILNLMTYSPSGLVKSYLNSLSAGNAQEAAAYQGVSLSDAEKQYASHASLNSLESISIVSDLGQSDGTHLVTASYEM